MSNIYGIYGSGIPGKTGETGIDGYNISVDSSLTKDGSVISIVLNNNDSSIVMKNFNTNDKEYYLNNLSFNVYSEINQQSIKYYQFNYSMNKENVDDLKIFAYILYNGTTTYSSSNTNSEYILLKDFYVPLTTVKTKIQYSENKKITKIIVFAFKKVKGSIYNKIFLEEKDF